MQTQTCRTAASAASSDVRALREVDNPGTNILYPGVVSERL